MTATVALPVPATQALPRAVRVQAATTTLPALAECRLGCQLDAGLYTPADVTARQHVEATGHTVVVTSASSTVYRAVTR